MDVEKNDNVQILTINKKKLKENPVGYEKLKSSKFKMIISKVGTNIAKLILLAATAIAELPLVKSVLSPILVPAVNTVVDMEINSLMEDFSKFISRIKGMSLEQELMLYRDMSTREGAYNWVGYLFHFVANFALKNPTIVIAGGVALTSLLTNKVLSPLIKKLVRQIKGVYNNHRNRKNANEIQLKIYNNINKIKKHNRFKIIRNKNAFNDVLNNVVKITSLSAAYSSDLYELNGVLEDIFDCIEKKTIKDYKQSIINIQKVLKGIEYKSFSEFSDSLDKKKR